MPKSQMRVRSQVKALTIMSAMHCACLVVTVASRGLLATPVVFTFSQTPPVGTHAALPPDAAGARRSAAARAAAPSSRPRRRGRRRPWSRPRRRAHRCRAPPMPPVPVPGGRAAALAARTAPRREAPASAARFARGSSGSACSCGRVDLQDLAPRRLAAPIGRLELRRLRAERDAVEDGRERARGGLLVRHRLARPRIRDHVALVGAAAAARRDVHAGQRRAAADVAVLEQDLIDRRARPSSAGCR